MEPPQKNECVVCTEVLIGKRTPISCPFCEDTKPRACNECTRRYLLDAVQSAHCMQCKHEWSYAFCCEVLGKGWYVGVYRKNRQEKAVEREKGRLAEAMPLVANAAEKKRLMEEEREIREALMKLKTRLRIVRERRRELEDGESGEKGSKEKGYMFGCPVEECKGLIEAETWKCSLCSVVVCSRCHVVKKREGEEEKGEKVKHACVEDDIATAKEVMKSTKSCPKCTTRIFKIEGCDQMYCVKCYTPFSWRSGEIVTGTIHNPHYYELQRKLGHVPGAQEDVPCGGLPQWHQICSNWHYRHSKSGGPAYEQLKKIHRLTGEVADYLREPKSSEKGTIDIRVAYLSGKINDEGLRRRLFLRERHNQRIKEYRNVLETFHVTMVERFRNLMTSLNGIVLRKESPTAVSTKVSKITGEMAEEAERIIAYCNEAMEVNITAIGFGMGPELNIDKGLLNSHFKHRGTKIEATSKVVEVDGGESSDDASCGT